MIRKVITHKDIQKYWNMSHEERQLRSKISIAKAHFNSVECVARHRMELDKYN